jgi:delta 1-pyrroline-5-carboxylate dehydrogenase
MNNFITAVIHENSFDKLVHYIEQAKTDKEVEVLAGGTYDKSKGYFVHPTLLKTTNPHYTTMETELFGPVVTVYVYEDKEWEKYLGIGKHLPLTMGLRVRLYRKTAILLNTLLESCAMPLVISTSTTSPVELLLVSNPSEEAVHLEPMTRLVQH